MTHRIARFLPALIGVALVALLSFLYVETQATHIEEHKQILQDIQRLKQLGADQNVDTFALRFGLLHDYDSVTAQTAAARTTLADLKRLVQIAFPEEPEDLQRRLRAYETLVTRKRQQVEEFKSANAVLNNSLEFFPTACADLEQTLAASRTPVALWHDVAAFQHVTLLYHLTGNASLTPRLNLLIGQAFKDAAASPPNARARLTIAVAHAATIVRCQALTNHIISEMRDLPVTESTDAIFSVYQNHYQNTLQRANIYRLYLYVTCVVFMLLVFAMVMQVRTKAVELRYANEHLEERVQTRTADLLTANSALVVARVVAEQAQADSEKINRQLEVAMRAAAQIANAAEREHLAKSVLLASIPLILISVDEEQRITQWSRIAEDMFGIASAQAVSQLFRQCPFPWNWQAVNACIAECQQEGKPVRREDVSFVRSNGKEGLLSLTVAPILEQDREDCSFLIVGTDMTERKMLETQLVHAQKMESIGHLAAGIAHEINTPTQYIGDNLQFLEEAFTDMLLLLTVYSEQLDEADDIQVAPAIKTALAEAARTADITYLRTEIPQALQQAQEGVQRVASIIKAVKEFSHPGTEGKTAIDINRAIESTTTVARNEWKYVADVVHDLDRTLSLVSCLPGELNQVILNLLVNAAHAISDVMKQTQEKGVITISTRRSGAWVEIRIADTGTGIPHAARSKIFDPFYTTKEVGKGTGQGLAIAHSIIVEKHGGQIAFETEMGRGTTFILRLPLEAETCADANALQEAA